MIHLPGQVSGRPASFSVRTIRSRKSSYGIMTFFGLFHHGLRHFGQTRGSSSNPPRGIHSWSHRSHRNPITVIGTRDITTPIWLADNDYQSAVYRYTPS